MQPEMLVRAMLCVFQWQRLQMFCLELPEVSAVTLWTERDDPNTYKDCRIMLQIHCINSSNRSAVPEGRAVREPEGRAVHPWPAVGDPCHQAETFQANGLV